MRTRTRALIVGAVMAASLGLAGAALAQDSGGDRDQAVVAINTKDGFDMFRFGFRIDRVMSQSIDTDNAAVAYSSCDSCETTAIAVQIVLAMNDPNVVTPDNLAIAINENCTSCETTALAYQIVMQTDGPVHFTPEGQREINRIRRELAAIEDDPDLTPEEKEARADALVDELELVLEEEMVKSGRSGEVIVKKVKDQDTGEEPVEGGEREDQMRKKMGGSPTPSATASIEPRPQPTTATAPPSPSATAQPTATPEPSS